MKRARTVAEARRIAEQIATAAGLPRCGHYRWTLDEHGIRRWDRLCGPRGRRGRVPPCLCASATDVDPECPWVTWGRVAVIELDGAVLLHGDPEDLDGHPEAAALPDEHPSRERLARAEAVR